MMEGFLQTGIDHSEVECKETSPNVHELVTTNGGNFKKCYSVCKEKSRGRNDGDQVEPIWHCTNGRQFGSKCTKSCPEGYKLKDMTGIDCRWYKANCAKVFDECKKTRGIYDFGVVRWSARYFKSCVPE